MIDSQSVRVADTVPKASRPFAQRGMTAQSSPRRRCIDIQTRLTGPAGGSGAEAALVTAADPSIGSAGNPSPAVFCVGVRE